jgi:hypothetical protein
MLLCFYQGNGVHEIDFQKYEVSEGSLFFSVTRTDSQLGTFRRYMKDIFSFSGIL